MRQKIHAVLDDPAYDCENLLGITNGDNSACILAHYHHDSLAFANCCTTHDEFRGSRLKTALLTTDYPNLRALCLVGYMTKEDALLKYLARLHLLQLVDYIGDEIHCPEVRRLLARFPVGETTACELSNLTPHDNDACVNRTARNEKGAVRRLFCRRAKKSYFLFFALALGRSVMVPS